MSSSTTIAVVKITTRSTVLSFDLRAQTQRQAPVLGVGGVKCESVSRGLQRALNFALRLKCRRLARPALWPAKQGSPHCFKKQNDRVLR